MKPIVTPSGAALGARIDNLDLSRPLTDEEFAIMKAHPKEGAKLILDRDVRPWQEVMVDLAGRLKFPTFTAVDGARGVQPVGHVG